MPSMNAVLLLIYIIYLACCKAEDEPLSEYIHVPARYIAPLPSNSILKDNTSPDRMSVSLCAAKCTLLFRSGNFPCYAFEFTPGSNMCIYTNITTAMLNAGFLSLKQNEAVHYYERPKGSFTNLFHEEKNTALANQGSYYSIRSNISLDQCAQLCVMSSEPGCLSFSYSSKMNTCGFSGKYHSRNDKTSAAIVKTSLYNHYQYFTSWPCNAMIPQNYRPKAIASVRFPYQAVRNIQCYVKLEAPTGHTIEISFSTIYFGGNLCNNNNNGYGITVHDGDSSTGPVIGQFCQRTKRTNTIVKSTKNSMFVTYKTGSVPMAFKAVYQFDNPCDANKCQNGGSCQLTNTSYVCHCKTGWSGRFCEANIDECVSDPCLFGGKCIDQLNSYKCECLKEFSGNRCEIFLGKCAEKPCVHGTCHVLSRFNYTCDCEKDYYGQNCDKRLQNRGYCSSNPCVHGKCVETFGYYMCQCYNGYIGQNCDTFFDPCQNLPCLQGVCTPDNGIYHCSCIHGYTGKDCDTIIDNCLGVNCNHGKCVSVNDTHVCECKDGWTGDACDIDNEFDPCKNAHCGTGLCEALHQNRMTYRCVCPKGFIGQHCESRVISNTKFIQDPCRQISCKNSGLCEVTNGRARCKCKAPYGGDFCQIRLNDCSFNPCHVNATCVDTIQGHKCICPKGWTGVSCDKNIYPCSRHPCINGMCQEYNNSKGYRCIRYTLTGHSNITLSNNTLLHKFYRKPDEWTKNQAVTQRNNTLVVKENICSVVAGL